MENPSLAGRLAALAPPFLSGLGQEELEKILQAAGAQTGDTEKTQEG